LAGSVDDRDVGKRKCEVEGLLTRGRDGDRYPPRGQVVFANECLVSHEPYVVALGDESRRPWRCAIAMSHERDPRASFVQLFGTRQSERRLAGAS
jgi:hypothetical protein